MEADFSDELRHHMEQEIENNMRAGMPPEEAKYAAQRLTGLVALYEEGCRDARGITLMDTFLRDGRYAWRTFRRTPLFTAVAVLTLALSIGANATVFTFIENVLLRSLPVHDPQQLLFLNWGGMVNISFPNYLDFRDRNTAFSDLIAYRFNPANLSIQARENFRIWGYEATGNYFRTLGVKPFLGRFFGPEVDDKPGAHPVVVLSYRYWQSHLAADPHVIGRQVKINGTPFTVVAITRPGFYGTELIVSSDYWVPMSMELQIEPGHNWLLSRGEQEVWVMGRLKPGVSRAGGEANLDAIARQLARVYPKEIGPKARFLLSRPGLVGQGLRGPTTSVGVVLMSVAALGLLLACVNLAGMLLARDLFPTRITTIVLSVFGVFAMILAATGLFALVAYSVSRRKREIGIRMALGARRSQVLSSVLGRTLVLCAVGVALGSALTFGAGHLLSAVLIGVSPRDPITYITALALMSGVAILACWQPASRAIRIDPARTLREE